MSTLIKKYGQSWNPKTSPIDMEIYAIRKGGKWKNKKGEECGEGLFYHYKELQKIIWPEDYHHRWSDLQLQEILNNTITAITGPKDSGKTHVALVRYGLTDYFCFPENTLIIVSSTEMRSLEGRVWGDMKSMFRRAKQRFPQLPGCVLESKKAICTDNLSESADVIRDMRRGILCVPCKSSSGTHLSISSYVGMKQERRRHLGDEFQFMSSAMLDSVANMNSGDYKGIFVGNPIGQDDPLDKITEPKGGWDSHPEPTCTTVWDNERFLNSRTICLYGPDSPNFDDPENPNKYKGLINQDGINRVVAGYGKDSHQYYSQCLGIRKSGLNARRVITKDICKTFNAFDLVFWNGKTTKIGHLDAAYGGVGGDRCVGGYSEFGRMINGKIGFVMHPPEIVPVTFRNKDMSPEDQISTWCKNYYESKGVSPQNFFYDSTGRGSLGPSLARIWSTQIQPVEFGGNATDRPVSKDFKIIDPKTGKSRLKTCKEHYSKFVTELWWSVRYAIESGQFRGMTKDVCSEGCAREWKEVSGGRIEIESKFEMKQRTGYSPDLFDWLVTGLEGARRRGFVIDGLGTEDDGFSFRELMEDLLERRNSLNLKGTLLRT